jgi:hypothetical protein
LVGAHQIILCPDRLLFKLIITKDKFSSQSWLCFLLFYDDGRFSADKPSKSIGFQVRVIRPRANFGVTSGFGLVSRQSFVSSVALHIQAL